MNKITRSTVNEQQYSAPEFPKSGFPLSYRRYSSFGLGKIHVGGFQFTMPGDKISGQTRGQLTFHRIVTPIVSPINAMQYNVYLPFRPLDTSFQKGITPTKLNGMSAGWTMPQFTTRNLVDQIMRYYFKGSPGVAPSPGILLLVDLISYFRSNPTKTLSDFCNAQTPAITVNDLLYTGSDSLVGTPVECLTTQGRTLYDMASNMFMCDSLLEISESIIAKLGTVSTPLSGSMLVSDFINLYFSTLLTPWVGRYSYYGEFKYEFLRPFDFYRLSRMGIAGLPPSPTWDDFLYLFSDTPQNEYAIRAMYAVWYELFRNVDLEPVSSTLPDWREFGSTSIFDENNSPNLCYLLYRIRSWEKDMFISAQIDDLSRHVYAPVTNSYADVASYHTDDINNLDTQGNNDADSFFNGNVRNPSIYTLGYLDQLTGISKSIQCPVPSNINDVLSATDKSFLEVYGLDLNTLRQSQMLERYLKRNYLFGDEYQDRMLAHYNSRVSDMRINKPQILSQSLNSYDMKQEVSNVSTTETKVGDRTATATCEVKGEPYTTFCEEFGIIISLICVMPRSMYDGTCPQHLLAKEVDLPKPEFATNNEEFGRKLEIAGSGLVAGGVEEDARYMFGRYPAYHAWRSRTDEVGGEFLDELQECTFRRFFGMFSEDTTPKLNYFFIHCRPNLNMFANNLAYDMQAYGDLVHECFVERVLPTPVESI